SAHRRGPQGGRSRHQTPRPLPFLRKPWTRVSPSLLSRPRFAWRRRCRREAGHSASSAPKPPKRVATRMRQFLCHSSRGVLAPSRRLPEQKPFGTPRAVRVRRFSWTSMGRALSPAKKSAGRFGSSEPNSLESSKITSAAFGACGFASAILLREKLPQPPFVVGEKKRKEITKNKRGKKGSQQIPRQHGTLPG
ncbi:Hypothetical protein, putative, partial [Bodo saltans]